MFRLRKSFNAYFYLPKIQEKRFKKFQGIAFKTTSLVALKTPFRRIFSD
jgi:hypothetical protein